VLVLSGMLLSIPAHMQIISPGRIEIWEAWLTLAQFPIITLHAFVSESCQHYHIHSCYQHVHICRGWAQQVTF
jgi:hypothetical protein